MAYLDIIEYYKNRLITQYRNKIRARGTTGVVSNCSVADGLPLQLQNAFNLDTAAGAQLTIIGKIVGVPRNVIGLDLAHTFFSFTRYAGTPASVGFKRYTDVNDTPLFLRYVEDASYTMSDFELRNVIRLRIIYNTRRMTYKAVQDGLFTYFGTGISMGVSGTSTMRCTYHVSSVYTTSYQVASYLNILPVSMGCSVDTIYT